jgi:hypothetical protein
MEITVKRSYDFSEKDQKKFGPFALETYYFHITWDDGEKEIAPVRSRAMQKIIQKAYEKGIKAGKELVYSTWVVTQ